MDKLAKQQACQLLIEQEIEEGLKIGRTPYSTGKELALKLEGLFREKAIEKEHERKTTLPKSAKSLEPPIDTRKEVAKKAGLSHDTIAKAGKQSIDF